MSRTAFLIAAAFVSLPLLSFGAQAAEVGCLPVDPAAFEEVRGAGALPGYPGWHAAVGLTKDRLPMTPTFLATDGELTCDLTRGLALFAGERAAPGRAADAEELALLAVRAIHVDVLPDAIALPGMGLAAERPILTPLERGYAADMTVWTPRNGVVADVRVVMDGAIGVTFVVRENAVGPFRGVPDGWNLQPGMTDATLRGEVDPQFTKVMWGTNADGVKWRVTYFTERYGGNEALADHHAAMHLSGALSSYANQTSWGLVSADPDRILDLTLDGCDCIYSGYQANIHMFPRANDILPLLPGLAYRAEEEVAELIVGHELFHHFQYSIQQWRHGNWLTEGMARFSETVNVPDFTFLPTTLVYWPNLNGMNGFLNSPSGSITDHSYDWAIVWGYLYANEGGMPFLVRALKESATGGTNGNVDGPAFIQRAMDATPGGTHATFAEAYAAFAQATLTHEGFVWGAPDGTQVHDWSTYFVPLERFSSPASTRILPSWGITSHDAKPGAALGSAVIGYTPNPNLKAYVYTQVGATRASAPANAVNTVAGADDAALLVVRASPPAPGELFGAGGSYAVTVAR